jgi:hypothetical protein
MSAKPVKLDKVTIGGIPPLEHCRRRRLAPEQLSPQGLQVTTRNPPGGRIDYLTPHQLRLRRGNFSAYIIQGQVEAIGSPDFWDQKERGYAKGAPILLGTKNKNPFRRFVGEASGSRRATKIRPEIRRNGSGR